MLIYVLIEKNPNLVYDLVSNKTLEYINSYKDFCSKFDPRSINLDFKILMKNALDRKRLDKLF